jgi:hypothetical protein
MYNAINVYYVMIEQLKQWHTFSFIAILAETYGGRWVWSGMEIWTISI